MAERFKKGDPVRYIGQSNLNGNHGTVEGYGRNGWVLCTFGAMEGVKCAEFNLELVAQEPVATPSIFDLLCENYDAWDGEEDSVKEEHEDLIRRTGEFIEAHKAARSMPGVLAALKDMRAAYGRLHDFISDAVEGGRLQEADLPDDYKAIVDQLEACATADAGAEAAIADAKAVATPDATLSALKSFVAACGGNPPDWLREEFAAAENAIGKAEVAK
jgi:hypothetical protein